LTICINLCLYLCIFKVRLFISVINQIFPVKVKTVKVSWEVKPSNSQRMSGIWSVLGLDYIKPHSVKGRLLLSFFWKLKVSLSKREKAFVPNKALKNKSSTKLKRASSFHVFFFVVVFLKKLKMFRKRSQCYLAWDNFTMVWFMKAFWSLKGQNPWKLRLKWHDILPWEKWRQETPHRPGLRRRQKPRTGQGYDNYDRKETIEFGCTQHESKRKRALYLDKCVKNFAEQHVNLYKAVKMITSTESVL